MLNYENKPFLGFKIKLFKFLQLICFFGTDGFLNQEGKIKYSGKVFLHRYSRNWATAGKTLEIGNLDAVHHICTDKENVRTNPYLT